MDMKKLVLIPVILFLASCSGGKGDSDAWGTFEATEIIISAEVPGKILHFNIQEGQILKEGVMIGLIDTTDWLLKKEQLLSQKSTIASKYPNVASQIAVQEQQLKNLRVEKDRIEKLYKESAATKKQLDDINGNIDLVQKQIQSIETQNTSVGGELGSLSKQIEQADENLKRCHIVNPVNGTVLDKYAEANEMTATGKSLYKIADLGELYLRVYISGSQLPNVKIGDKVDVFVDKDENSNQKLEGEVSWISTTAEFTPKIIQTKQERVNLVYAMKVRVKNDGTLKIGMPGEIKFQIH
jgi:HlyD family secretion protein